MRFFSPRIKRPFSLILILLSALCLLIMLAALPGRNISRRDFMRSGAIKAGSAIESQRATPLTHAQAREAYGQLALSFEANRGQTNESVNFLARGAGYTLFLKPTEAVFVLARQSDKRAQENGDAQLSDARKRLTASRVDARGSDRSQPLAVLRMKLVGADEGARVEGLDELEGKVNYFVGDDSSRWLTENQTFGRVRYGGVYPGIDLVYYGNQRQLEYDFRVAPGMDARAVKLEFEGADKVEVEATGDLLLTLGEGTMRQPKPVLYQEVAGVRRAVDGGYVVGADGRVGFRVGEYDAHRTLVIDPVLSYSTYLGGSDSDEGNDIALDSAGNAYICGNTASTNFPTANAIQATFGGANFTGGRDGFVTKLNATGTALIYSTYLGGSGDDRCNKIAVDSSGNAYVAGETTSSNFPTANALQSTFGGGLSDAFVTKINAAGSALVYSTYLGGTIFDAAHALTIDSTGSAYITGRTTSSNFPVVNPIQAAYSGGPGADAFVTKFNPAGSAIVYSTYLGGNAGDSGGFTAGFSIAVDSAGNAYVTGQTRATNFPIANAIQATFGGGFPDGDAFVSKLNATGTALVYSTYLGGSDNDIGFEIALDSVGSAHVTGVARSTNFPTANAFQSTLKGTSDAFVTKFNAAGTAFSYSTYLGGTADDSGNGIAVDSAGNAYVAGGTSSTDFPLVNPIQGTMAGVFDVFLTKFNVGGSALTYSTYFGGSGGDTALAVAVDSANSMYMTGRTASTNFPTLNPVQSANAGGTQDAFVMKISDPPAPVTSTVQFQQATYDVTEDVTFVTVKVTRTGDTSTAANVDYATSDVVALQRTDYTIAIGTLRFAAAETEKNLNILINEDSYLEGRETFNITLSNPTGNASLGANPSTTLRITDDATEPSTNVIDDAQIFVGQHYHDFLNRQADAGGLAYWTNEITKCGADQACINSRRIGVSAAFFIEMEFQDRGAFVHYLYRAGLGRRPMFLEFTRDRSFLTAGGNVAADMQTLATDFVQRAEFTTKYGLGLSRDQFVDALLLNVQQTSGVNLTSRRNELLAEYDAGANQTQSRARVLLRLVGYTEYKQAEYNRAFVLAQYFGYLRRDPDEDGYQFWLNILNNVAPNNYRAVVCAFITSTEYQQRFSSVVTHSNAECSE
jgi:Calx-beta domain/Beta-propeller repeat/Domain of unknown function (DUF4214)